MYHLESFLKLKEELDMTETILIMKEYVIQGSHFSCDTKFHVFPRLFPSKSNEIQGQFGFESVFVLIM